MGEKRNVYCILVSKQTKRLLQTSKCRWEDNIKMTKKNRV